VAQSQEPKGFESVFKVPDVVNMGLVKLRQRANNYNMKLNKLMKPPLPKYERTAVQMDSETIWNKEWAFKKQRSLPEIRPLHRFLGEGTVQDKFVQKDKYKFQEAK
jgi:hypothetical protein